MATITLTVIMLVSCLVPEPVFSCHFDFNETHSKVIFSAQRYFNSDCVYFMDSDVFFVNCQILSTQRGFSDLGIQSSVIKTQSVVETNPRLLTSCNKPIYTIFDDKDAKIRLNLLSTSKTLSGKIWVLFVKDSSNMDTYFLSINIPFDCQFIVAAPPGSDGRVVLTEVYRVAEQLELQKLSLGSWSLKNGFDWPKSSFYSRRTDLQQVLFKTTANTWPPLAYVTRGRSTKQAALEGFAGRIWKVLENQMNFKSEHRRVSDGSWGNLKGDGTWDGMMGALINAEANMTSVAFTITPERFEYVSFTFPLFVHYIRIYMKQPSRNASLGNLMSPFSPELWLAFLISAIAVSAILSFFHKVKERRSITHIFFQVFGAMFCQQGSADLSRATSVRTIMFISYLLGVIGLTSFSCYFISSLTNDIPKPPFSSLSGILKDGSYSLGMFKSGWIFGEFKNAHERKQWPLKQLYERHIASDPENTALTIEEGLTRLCEKRYLYIVEENTLEFMDAKCELVRLTNYFSKRSIGFGFPKGSPYVGIFNSKLLKMMSSGIIKKHYSDAVHKYPRTKPNENISASFETVRPVLSFGAVGIVVSLLALALEVFWFYIRKIVITFKHGRTRRKYKESFNMRIYLGKQRLKSRRNHNVIGQNSDIPGH